MADKYLWNIGGAETYLWKISSKRGAEYALGSDESANAITLSKDGSTQDSVALKTINGSPVIGSGDVETLGQSGALTLPSSGWSGGACMVSVTGLGANDAIFVKGATASDQKLMGEANLFAVASEGSVTFSAETTPTSSIALSYFIMRGK